ncbi:MAG: UPF0261 family protein [Deltaproteobacteria bacterium HGW-Deltaproteobacteria-15]|jgi:uncharacterized protein (UPF0261 family)|nr:MAG: UPF0261 family protein [Deltaproteobacteria bacterium HGW-Deltaproteobacteria-15]
MGSIVIVGTLDTKGEQILYLREKIELLGHRVLVMDVSTGERSAAGADITCDEVAEAAGTSMHAIRNMRDRGKITSLMISGATRKAREAQASGLLDGIVSLGGAGAATIGTSVMKGLPFGIPKLMVSSAAGMGSYAGRWFGTGDIMMMNTIVDLAGLNELVKNVLSRAAGSICGMVQQAPASLSSLLTRGDKPLVAMTEDGSSEKCASFVRNALKEKGYDVVIFHAQGIGDRAMEEMIDQGFFDGVVDIVLIGVSDELFEGNRPGGPFRLEMAGKRGIPQVLAPCGLNQTGAGPTRRNAEKYSSRPKILKLDELRMGTRLNEEELLLTAGTIARKLNQARGPVKFFIPLRGWSNFDPPGGILYDPEEDQILVKELKRLLDSKIEIIEIDANLEDAVFAKALVEGFEELMKRSRTEGHAE